MEKKKMKLLKTEVIRMKQENGDLLAKVEKLETDSKAHEKDIETRDQEISDLKEENHKNEDNMLQL